MLKFLRTPASAPAVEWTALSERPKATRAVPYEPAPLSEADNRMEQYAAVADKVGFAPDELRRYREAAGKRMIYARIYNQLVEFLNGHDLPIFNYAEVARHMARAARAARHRHWRWVPLRTVDNKRYQGTRTNDCDPTGWASRIDYDNYRKIVPVHALNKVAMIESSYPRPVAFFVSDYASHNPDPFLLVAVFPEYVGAVIDVWDEPGFDIESMVK